jgi:hypothetical protein
MAALAVALAVAIYFSAEQVHEHKKNKRILKAQEALDHGFVDELWATDDIASHPNNEQLPAYHKERLPLYSARDQASAAHSDKRNRRHHGSRLRKYLRGHSDNRTKQ